MSFSTGQVYIGEPSTPIDRTRLVWDGGQMGFTGTRGERGQATLELCLLPGETYDPQIGWPVWIYDPPVGVAGSECRFVGTIEDREFGWIGDAGLEIISLSVLSLEQLYDTQPCPEVEFPDGTDAGTIAASLFGSVSPPVSVTVGTIEAGVSLDKRTYDPKTNIWSAIKQLALDSNLIAFIDPRDQKFYFVSNGARSAGFTLLTEDLIQNGTSPLVHYKQNRSDFRNHQIMQVAANAVPPINAQIPMTGLTDTYTLPSIAQQILGAILTTSISGTAAGTFTGDPSDGDTITIAGITYTWRTAIDNTVADEILIGGIAHNNAVNLAAAITENVSLKGTSYSYPTVINSRVTADTPAGDVVTVRATTMGTGGNEVTISESCTDFTWSTATISGGSNALGVVARVGVEGTGTFDLYYTPGSSAIRFDSTPGSGQTLSITYTGTAQINSGNDAASSLGVGDQYKLFTPRNVVTQAGFQQQNAAVLSAFSVIPGQFSFQSYHRGFYPGDTLAVALTVPAGLAARVNGSWLIQDVRGEWVEGWENLPDDNPDRHFRCNVTCINSTQFNNYQNTLQRLVDVGGTGSGEIAPTQEPLTGSSEAQLTAYQPPIQIADTTVGADKGPHICVATPLYSLSPLNYKIGQLQRLQGVLRQTLSADLVIRINKIAFGSPSITQYWDFTFPAGWPVDDPIYLAIEGEVGNGDIFYPGIVSGPSPAVKDANGVASVTVVWV